MNRYKRRGDFGASVVVIGILLIAVIAVLYLITQAGH